MAEFTRDQLMQALRNADAAGDAEAARAIAQRIKGMSAVPTTASLIKSGQDLRTDAQRREDESLGLSSELPYGMPPNKVGEMVTGFVPGVGVAEGVFGKQVAFEDPDSPFPTGVKDVPTIAGNLRQGNYGTAALQTIGLIPDAGFAAGAAKIAPQVARGMAQTGREIAAMPGALVDRAKPQAIGSLTEEVPEGTPGIVTLSPAAKKAEDQMYQQLVDSGWTPEKARERAKWLGSQGTLADLEPFEAISKTSSTTLKGQREARRTLESRTRGAEGRMLATLDVTLPNENYYEALDALRASRTAEAQPARQAALADASIAGDQKVMLALRDDPVIQRMQKTPEFQKGLREGARIIQLESARTGETIPKTETWFHGTDFNNPDIVIEHTPTLRMLDAAKQGFDQILAPFRNKYTGALENLGPYEVEVDKARRALVESMRGASPKYAEYLDKWAEPSQQMDALARGRKILANDPEVTLKTLRKATDAEREYTQIGLRRALEDKIRENPQAAVRLFNKGATRDKIRAVFPSKGEFRTLHRQALREAAFQKTRNANIARSATGELKQSIKEVEEAESLPKEAVGAGVDALMGNKLAVVRRGLSWASRKLSGKPSDKVLDEISPVAFSRDPVMKERMIQRFKRRSMPTIYRGVDELEDEALP